MAFFGLANTLHGVRQQAVIVMISFIGSNQRRLAVGSKLITPWAADLKEG